MKKEKTMEDFAKGYGSIEEPFDDIDNVNFENYKTDSKEYHKLIKKITQSIPTEKLIEELKRRKLIKFDWNKEKFVEVQNEQ